MRDLSDRVPNEEVVALSKKEEPRFLSLLLKDKECLSDAIASGIKGGGEGHFWTVECQILYSIIEQYYHKYQAKLSRTGIDSVMDTISEIGGETIQEDKTSVRAYWDRVYNMEVDIEDYSMLRDHINSRYVQWKAYEIMQNQTERIVKSSGDQLEVVKDIQKRFQSIDTIEKDRYSLTMSMDEGIEKALTYIEQRREHPEITDSILTYINGIDDVYHGFQRGSYNIISGMINGGKSTLMINIGFNMAKHGYNVVYVSLEKKAEPLYQRLLSMHGMIDYNRIKVGGDSDKGLNDLIMRQYKEAARDLKENIKPNFHVVQMPQTTKLTKILNEIDKIHVDNPVDVIIVDYLGVVGHETSHPGRPDLDEAITSQRLQAYGRINDFVTITGLQLKTSSSKEIRGKAKKATSDGSTDVEVNTEDMAGSKMVIADADNALGIILNGEHPPTQAFIYGTKARDDQARSKVTLDFDGRLGLITDPQIEPGQITDMAEILYNEEIDSEVADDTVLFKKSVDKVGGNFDQGEKDKVDLDAFLEQTNEGDTQIVDSSDDPDDPDDSDDDLDDIFGD